MTIQEAKLQLINRRSLGYCRSRLRLFILQQANLINDDPIAKQVFLKELNQFLEKQILNK